MVVRKHASAVVESCRIGPGTQIDAFSQSFSRTEAPPLEPGMYASAVAGVFIHRLPLIYDPRGLLTVAEPIAFEVKRFFLVFGVPSRDVRGQHAHRTLHQFLVCVHGECRLTVDNGQKRQEIILDSPTIGVHVPPMVWAIQSGHSSDAVLMVMASDVYDPEDYIRDYSEFRSLAAVLPDCAFSSR